MIPPNYRVLLPLSAWGQAPSGVDLRGRTTSSSASSNPAGVGRHNLLWRGNAASRGVCRRDGRQCQRNDDARAGVPAPTVALPPMTATATFAPTERSASRAGEASAEKPLPVARQQPCPSQSGHLPGLRQKFGTVEALVEVPPRPGAAQHRLRRRSTLSSFERGARPVPVWAQVRRRLLTTLVQALHDSIQVVVEEAVLPPQRDREKDSLRLTKLDRERDYTLSWFQFERNDKAL